jgi:hypothetical protein
MDHLPVPHRRNASTQDLVVTLRCDPATYDEGPLETHPTRRSFHLNYWADDYLANKLTLLDGSKPSVEQTTTLLHEWIFFGLLVITHAIYGTTFNPYDYVKTIDGVRMLTLRTLPHHATVWYDSETGRSRKERQRHYRTLQWHLMRAAIVSRE